MVDPKSLVGITPGDSSSMIGYQVDNITLNWSAKPFVTKLQIYAGFTSKVFSLAHFPLKVGCEDYSLLGQVVEEFEHGLDSIFTASVDTLKLDSSFD